ncbi:Low-density lipoprotein receptor-related protein 12 [Bagarius yarrelli]|uniref:Low-density lipoprotein receptor-related protein 12 n=1 Tax=Bagarius yarrelli TaxID=175774 RepID=A0A556VU58_BAGYA|nr:Low-density lipoprotein receptor-related protein 12 [Bagarius yarrelli]
MDQVPSLHHPQRHLHHHFQDFELQSSHRCGLDWLSIGTYKNLDGYRACGSSIPAPYISSQDHVWIKFHSDDTLTGKGFRLSYITELPSFCFHILSTPQERRRRRVVSRISSTVRTESASPRHGGATRWTSAGTTLTKSCVFTPSRLPLLPPSSPSSRALSISFPACRATPESSPVSLLLSLRCDGAIDCQDLSDEIDCDAPACSELRLQNFYGTFNSPNYPDFYPPGSDCTWLIDTGDRRRVVLRFLDFKLDGTGYYGDFVKVYDGLETEPRRLLRVLTALDSRTSVTTIISSSGQLRVHFYSDKINTARGFNATYQVEGFCLPWEMPCGGNWGCYTEQQRCDGYWHCANGRDELNCSGCGEDEFPCSRNGACYPRSDRCNYQNRCPNGSDEKNCAFCQPGNFHCRNGRCVFESWVCDAQDDCGDASDEDACPVAVPTRVIAAAVIGSLVCGLLLVIALGCTCKLYSLRSFERRSFETQLSRVEAELLRREAPPSYGQLIAQGLIPPVEDFPVCSGNQASVLENLRLAVRSQLGFTSIRLPSSGRRGNVWRRLFNFTRSRHSASLALVSSGAGGESDSGSGANGVGISAHIPDRLDSDDSESEQQGAVGGASVSLLPHKTPPTATVVSVSASSAPQAVAESDEIVVPPPSGRGSFVTRGLRWVRMSLGSRFAQQAGSPLRQMQNGTASEEDDDEDVELLVPLTETSDAPSATPSLRGRPTIRDGPCERCGMVHTAQIPDACLEATARTETSDDDSLLLC